MVTLVNRAKVATATTGTGTLTLGSAESGYQSFADAGVVDTDIVRYVIEDGTDWEIGTGTYSAGTLTRTVSESSNADAALNLTGSAVVYVSATAEDIPPVLELYAENPSSPNAPSATGANAVAIGTNSGASGIESVSIGGNSNVSGDYSIALGNSNDVTASFAGAIGLGADATGNYAFALGAASFASGLQSVAIGRDTDATSSGALAIGYQAQARTGSNATAISRSYASGTDSFAAAIANNTSSYGATGANSVAIGKQAKASVAQGIAIGDRATTATGGQALAIGQLATASGTSSIGIAGYMCTASGAGSVAIGSNYYFGTPTSSGAGSIVIGDGSTASAQYSMVWGHAGSSTIIGKQVHSSGRFASSGDSQQGRFILRSDTTDAPPEAITTNNSTPSTTNQIILPNNSAYAFHGTIVARQQASAGTACAAWKIEGLIRREGSAGTTVLVNSATTVLDNTPGWGMTLSADTTNGGLKIEVTGAAATNIRFVATVHTSEVTY